jgi:ribonuclease P protein component
LQGRKRVDGFIEMAFARTGTGGVRLGVAVSSRFLPRAVDRNAFKRIVREAFRTHRAQLPAGDVLIRLRQSLKQREQGPWHQEAARSLKRLFGSIGS